MLCKFEGNFDRHISSRLPFFGGQSCWCTSTALRNALPFLFDIYSLILFLSELLPQFIFKFSPHVDGTHRQMLCKFEGNFDHYIWSKLPFFGGQSCWCTGTALRHALPFLFDIYSLILLLPELLPQFVFKFSPHIDGTYRQMLCKFEGILIITFWSKLPFFCGHSW